MLMAMTLFFAQCKPEEEEPVVPEIRFDSDKTAFESDQNSVFEFEVKLNQSSQNTVTVQYSTMDGTATAGEDYTATSGTLTFAPGDLTKTISVNIFIDEFLEGDETFTVSLSNPVNGYLKDNLQEAIGTIKNDDTTFEIVDEGYEAATSYAGKMLVWSDEFDGTEIDPNNWTYDLGANGWGNQELQNYTNSSNNSFIQDGMLVMMARDEGGEYTSARLKSVDLQEFQYGRIDFRAILPVDQGMWPALWMLGANFPEIGWPDCGEIDVMELVGTNPRRVHGTCHFGDDPGQHQYDGQGISLPFPDTFADEFHVFSVEWSENSITWYLDDEEYHSIDESVVGSQNYPFNQPFFFIMNVAVGGEWPGDPDETTTFPEFMAVDYVRVYQ